MHAPQYSYRSKNGQALLVLVLLIALVITVVTSVSYRLTTETQTTKSQEENVRSLAAADSGIERGISMINAGQPNGVYAYSHVAVGMPSIAGINPTRSTIELSSATAPNFVSPDVPKDEQYTFYVNNYPTNNSPYAGNLQLFFASNGLGSCAGRSRPAIEVTIIHGNASDQVDKFLYEHCTGVASIGGPYNTRNISPTQVSENINGTNFTFRTTPINMGAYTSPKVVIVRVLFANSRVAFRSLSGGALPVQGRQITSQAVLNSGVSKVVTLLQTYPQIPADFFVTTF